MAAARLLGSPQSARGSAESVSSLGGGGGGDARDSDLRRSSSSRGIMASPLSGRSTAAAMKRVATAHAPLRQMSASGGALSSTNVSFVDERLGGDDARARASSDGSSLDASVRGGGGEGDVTSTHAEPFASASQEARRRRAVPTSRAFARSREHLGGRSSSPPGREGARRRLDERRRIVRARRGRAKHRRLDPEKRLARRRVAEERATRSARARADQLRFANPKLVSSIETFANGAAPSCLTLHPLTPTATVADTRGKVQTWDYETGRRLHAFDAGLPGRRIASAGLINDLDDAVLFTAGVDGSVRVWRDYACPGQESLVAALRALPLPALDATASSNSPPTVGRNAAERRGRRRRAVRRGFLPAALARRRGVAAAERGACTRAATRTPYRCSASGT